MSTRDELRRRGGAVRKELGLQRAEGGEPLPNFDDFIAEVSFGGIWDRPNLGKPDR